jgi:hypothetical protein
MRRRRLLIAAAMSAPAALMAACSSVPLATLWRLRGLGVDEFFALDPAQLRAAVRTDQRATFESVDVGIDVRTGDQAPIRHSIRLQQGLAADPRLGPAPAGMKWHVFALGAEGVRVFDSVRRQVLALPRGQGSSVTLSVAAREGQVPPEIAARLPVRVDMLLDPKDGWFTLVSETRLDTTRSAGRKGP